MLLRSGEDGIGADRVGRMLVGDNALHGMTMKENQARFEAATEENYATGLTHSQWSWLKTMVLYKMNTLRAMTKQPLFAWSAGKHGAIIGWETEQVQPQEPPRPITPAVSSSTSQPGRPASRPGISSHNSTSSQQPAQNHPLFIPCSQHSTSVACTQQYLAGAASRKEQEQRPQRWQHQQQVHLQRVRYLLNLSADYFESA
jgi:hypothetical protein